jgi:nucleotide-binding universal stress UspA family protein
MAKRFLIPLDGSDSGEALLKPVENLASPGDTFLLLMVLHSEHPMRRGILPGNPVFSAGAEKVGTTPDMPAAAETREQMIDRQVAEARDYLEGVAASLRERGFGADLAVELDDDLGKGIINVAKQTSVDLIAMHSRDHGGIVRRLLSEDDTEEVMDAGIAPVLVVPLR